MITCHDHEIQYWPEDGCRLCNAQAQIARLQAALLDAGAEIHRLKADVDFLMKDNMGMREVILSAQEEADTAWNDAIEEAVKVYMFRSGPDTWDYFSGADDAIRALRRP